MANQADKKPLKPSGTSNVQKRRGPLPKHLRETEKSTETMEYDVEGLESIAEALEQADAPEVVPVAAAIAQAIKPVPKIPVELEQAAAKAKNNFFLPSKKISILLNQKPTAFIPDINHVSSGLAPNGKYSLVIPMDRDGRLINPLTPQEQEFFEDSARSGMYFGKGDLNITNPADRNFWLKYRLDIPKEGIHLDLSFPEDYLTYAAARVNKTYIAPSYAERMNKATYKFYIHDREIEVIEEATLADMEATAYMKIGEIKGNRVLAINVLKLLGRPMTVDVTDQALVAEMRRVIKEPNGLQRFLTTVGDPNLLLKIDILKGYQAGYLGYKNNRYMVKDVGLHLGTLEESVAYYKDPNNQDMYLALRAAIA